MFFMETPVDIAKGVAERIRRLRRARRMTIKELSSRSGVAYSTLRRFESTGEIAFLSLIKRPLLIGDGFVLTGFQEKEWEEALLQGGSIDGTTGTAVR